MNRYNILEIISKNTISSRLGEGSDLIHEVYVSDLVDDLLKSIDYSASRPKERLFFEHPFRVGRKNQNAIMDSTGIEVIILPIGQENEAQRIVGFLNGDNTEAKSLSDYDKIKQFVDDLEQGAYVLRQPLRFKTGIEDADQIKHLEQMVKDGILKKRYKLYCSNCDKEGDFTYDENEDIDEQCSECYGAFDETYQVTTHYKKI